MKTRATARVVLDKLAIQHPGADTELHYDNAYQLLVATVLSAQSTDRRVNEVTPALFQRYPDARALAGAEPTELEPLIKSTGFFRSKSRSLSGLARKLVEEYRWRCTGHDGRPDDLTRSGTQDRQRRAGPCPWRSRPPRRSSRPSSGQPHRPRKVRRSGSRRISTRQNLSERRLDQGFRHAHPARSSNLPSPSSLRSVRSTGWVRLLSKSPTRGD